MGIVGNAVYGESATQVTSHPPHTPQLPELSWQGCWRVHPCPGILAATSKLFPSVCLIHFSSCGSKFPKFTTCRVQKCFLLSTSNLISHCFQSSAPCSSITGFGEWLCCIQFIPRLQDSLTLSQIPPQPLLLLPGRQHPSLHTLCVCILSQWTDWSFFFTGGQDLLSCWFNTKGSCPYTAAVPKLKRLMATRSQHLAVLWNALFDS